MCYRMCYLNPSITDVVSGTTRSRKGLDRLMRLVHAGKVNVVVAYKLDRIGQN